MPPNKAFWASQSPSARLEALELRRQMAYCYDPITDRLERVPEVVKRVLSKAAVPLLSDFESARGDIGPLGVRPTRWQCDNPWLVRRGARLRVYRRGRRSGLLTSARRRKAGLGRTRTGSGESLQHRSDTVPRSAGCNPTRLNWRLWAGYRRIWPESERSQLTCRRSRSRSGCSW